VSIKAVVLDCDGVILESTDIKTEAFRALFEKDHPDRIGEIVSYHLATLGLSRAVKLRHICVEILGEPCPAEREARLASDFSRLVFERVLACPMVPGALEFLRGQHGQRRLFVASGTPQEELTLLLERRGLADFFERAWGAPARKPDVLREVLALGPFRPGEVAFVGDAPSDQLAAQETGVRFVRRIGSSVTWGRPPCPWELRGLNELEAILRRMEAPAGLR
jgi:phosphoglycolate phosphatase-like HAD superfamily hydrolase